jgi:hypothetical protein
MFVNKFSANFYEMKDNKLVELENDDSEFPF